jgi:ribokinase
MAVPARPVRVVCVGSLNLDLVATVPRLPTPDETILATSLAQFHGGKGANQAVAAARLGADTAMVGCVGFDGTGRALLAGLDEAGVDRRFVRRVEVHTGTALITVSGGDAAGGEGDVTIVVVPGANAAVTEDVLAAAASEVTTADVLLLQGEIPAGTAGAAARLARDAGVTVVFNPAPFNDVAEAVLPHADVVVANRAESAALGVLDATVVTTLGPDGCLVRLRGTGSEGVAVPASAARVVDPTGAGDAFVAAFAVRLAEGADPVAAASFANAAGACAVEVAGAQPSLPTRAVVEARLAR